MVKVFIIADDYTGALDTGVQFAACGAPVLVTTYEHFSGLNTGDCEVLAVNSESRHLAPAEAAERVSRLTREAVRRGFTHFYKKTDSTLRGNVGAELAAMLEGGGGLGLAFAPAYPKSGRVTVDGVQYVDGVPLGDSVFARDPYAPVRHGEVSRILLDQTDIAVVNRRADVYRDNADVGVDLHRAGNAFDAAVYHGAAVPCGADVSNTGRVIEVYDAESDGDLLCIGRYLKARGELVYLAGCAGFAGILPEIYGIGKYARTPPDSRTPEASVRTPDARTPEASVPPPDSRTPEASVPPPDARTPETSVLPPVTRTPEAITLPSVALIREVLLVSGSVNPITLKQLCAAEEAGFHIFTLQPEQKLDRSESNADTLLESISESLRVRKRVIIAAAVTPDDIHDTDEYALKFGLYINDIQNLICSNIGRLTVNILKRSAVSTLAVFGGDTLHDILTRAAIPAVRPVRELSPGIVESEAAFDGRIIRLITKSGGLGGDDALSVIY